MAEMPQEQAPVASKIEGHDIAKGPMDLSRDDLSKIAKSKREQERIVELKLAGEKREQLKRQIDSRVNPNGPPAPGEQLTQDEARELAELSKKLDTQPGTTQDTNESPAQNPTEKAKGFFGDVVSFASQVYHADSWGDRLNILMEKGSDMWEKFKEVSRDTFGAVGVLLVNIGVLREIPSWMRPMPKDLNVAYKAAKAEGMELEIARNEQGDVSKDAMSKAARLMTAVRKNAPAGHVNDALRAVIRGAKKENADESSVTFDELIALAEKTPATQPAQNKPPETAPQAAKREFKNIPDGENLLGNGATIEADGRKYDVSLATDALMIEGKRFVARVAGTVPLTIHSAMKKGDAIEFTMGALGQRQNRLMDRPTLEDFLKSVTEKNKYEFKREKPEDPLVTVVPV